MTQVFGHDLGLDDVRPEEEHGHPTMSAGGARRPDRLTRLYGVLSVAWPHSGSWSE